MIARAGSPDSVDRALDPLLVRRVRRLRDRAKRANHQPDLDTNRLMEPHAHLVLSVCASCAPGMKNV